MPIGVRVYDLCGWLWMDVVAPDSRPGAIVEGIARLLVKVAPSLPLAEGVKGKLFPSPLISTWGVFVLIRVRGGCGRECFG